MLKIVNYSNLKGVIFSLKSETKNRNLNIKMDDIPRIIRKVSLSSYVLFKIISGLEQNLIKKN